MRNPRIITSYLGTLAVAALSLHSFECPALPINVGYTVSGNSGNYTLNFSVLNHMPIATGQNLYLFGVELSGPDVTGSPGFFDPTAISTWDNTPFGGSTITYNNVWVDGTLAGLAPGILQSGFVVHVTDATPPISVNWFAFTFGPNDYLGSGNFNGTINPGFEGLAFPTPDAGATVVLLGIALGAVGMLRRKMA